MKRLSEYQLKSLRPGSERARKYGCLCDPRENRNKHIWVTVSLCPLHGAPVKP